MRELLTPEEAACRLRVSTKHLRQITRTGALRYVNIGCGDKRPTRRYTAEDLEAFLEGRTETCQSTAAPAKKSSRTTSCGKVVDFLDRQARPKRGTRVES